MTTYAGKGRSSRRFNIFTMIHTKQVTFSKNLNIAPKSTRVGIYQRELKKCKSILKGNTLQVPSGQIGSH
jgi:hypothetical protein